MLSESRVRELMAAFDREKDMHLGGLGAEDFQAAMVAGAHADAFRIVLEEPTIYGNQERLDKMLRDYRTAIERERTSP